MSTFTLILSIILSLFSTSVMSYIALATPVGPWISPTLVCIILLIRVLLNGRRKGRWLRNDAITYSICAGSVGGIVATACAFSFPTLYFLDASTFNEWMQHPLFFCVMLGLFSLFAGLFGMVIATKMEWTLHDDRAFPFPVSQLVQKMITTNNYAQRSSPFFGGFCISVVWSWVHNSIHTIMSRYTIALQWNILPMVVAIGFMTGHSVVLPLAMGLFVKLFFFTLLHALFLPHLSQGEFMLSLCTGMVFFSCILSTLSALPHSIKKIKEVMRNTIHIQWHHLSLVTIIMTSLYILIVVCYFSYFAMPISMQLYLIICSAITCYYIASIAGRIGLALLGRFATFVMIPALFLFPVQYTHITFITTFVEISGGVAADLLSGKKIAQLGHMQQQHVHWYQLLGLVVSAMSIGIIFWFLIHHCGLGSPELFAYRAQSRQLLIHAVTGATEAQKFDYSALIFGALFAMLLHYNKINVLLSLSGLLMPVEITAWLVIGGLLGYDAQKRERWYSLWSGIFTGSSLCMILSALLLFFA